MGWVQGAGLSGQQEPWEAVQLAARTMENPAQQKHPAEVREWLWGLGVERGVGGKQHAGSAVWTCLHITTKPHPGSPLPLPTTTTLSHPSWSCRGEREALPPLPWRSQTVQPCRQVEPSSTEVAEEAAAVPWALQVDTSVGVATQTGRTCSESQRRFLSHGPRTRTRAAAAATRMCEHVNA